MENKKQFAYEMEPGPETLKARREKDDFYVQEGKFIE